MSEQPDKESKTEEATPRRIEEALGKGNMPTSREVAPFASIIAVAISLPIAKDMFWHEGVYNLGALYDRATEIRLNTGDDAIVIVGEVGLIVAKLVVAPLLILMVFGLVAAFVQNPPRMVGQRIKPDFSRISLGKGIKRLVGLQNSIEFLKSSAKLSLMASVVVGFLVHYKIAVLNAVMINPHDLPAALMQHVSDLFFYVACLLAVLVGADIFWSRLKWHRDLRMSKQEIKDEQKQAEGDPIVRARQRSLARDRSRRRMMAAVPRATVVIANPTHYAVALRYVREESATPIVIAKGLDNIAIKIRETAEQHKIPVIEDKALARSLYAAVVPDRPIPPEFYRAVAEIILFLMSRKTPSSSTQTKAS